MIRKQRFAYDGRPLPDIINLHLKGTFVMQNELGITTLYCQCIHELNALMHIVRETRTVTEVLS